MEIIKPARLYNIAFWLSMPLITFALMYIIYKERIWYEWKIWVVCFSLIYPVGYLSWRLHVQYDHFLRTRFPSLEQTGERALYRLGVNLLIMTPSILLVLCIFDAFHILGYRIGQDDLRYSYFVGLAVNLVFETLWEVVYIIDKYKESVAEKEVLVKLQLEQELDLLKQKVNPHFLFNCFNTLSALISEDKDKAELFLDELSSVYRYLLKNNEDSMSTLESELKFIHSYAQLLKTRHCAAVEIQIDADKQYMAYLLPSLSLQLLVENAVKHNVLSRNKPLHIEIFTTAGNKLIVNNNRQLRTIKGPSNRVGLQNIRAKYKLLNQPGFEVMEDERNFTVVMPLIWNKNF